MTQNPLCKCRTFLQPFLLITLTMSKPPRGKGSDRDEGSEGTLLNHRQPAAARCLDQETFSARPPSEAPISGFKTPYITSSTWENLHRLNNETVKDKQLGEDFSTNVFDGINRNVDPYPAWPVGGPTPVSREDIEAIFLQLTDIFGFQYDNTKNMFDYFMRLLDSRASRASPEVALRSLHADYIGGANSNFKKWYFASQLDLDDSVGFQNVSNKGEVKKKIHDASYYSLHEAEKRWCNNMRGLSAIDRTIQVALYLLCWGEANNVRFMPECLCFIFKCCNDYYYSLNADDPIKNVTSSFLDHIITPLYNFHRGQIYEKIKGKWEKRDKDHKNTIGYDDINQIFWYKRGLQQLVLNSGVKLLSFKPEDRYLQLSEVNWKKAFYKTFLETRSWSHVLVNFNRIWVIHVCSFWYYTVFNSPTFYTSNYRQELDNQPTTQDKLLFTALAGPIACVITLLAVLLESSFVPRKWPGAKPVLKRIIFLISLLGLNLGPTLFILITHGLGHESTMGLAISWVQLAVSSLTVFYISIVPTRNIFGPKESLSDRNYLANKYFLETPAKLKGSDRMASQGIWFAIFLSKLTESYFFITLSLKDLVRELSTMKLTKCAGDIWIGTWMCSHQPKFLLVLIILSDFILFLLDTYLWYIVWNTAFSVCRSFYIGVSIWTPWKNIFLRLPKRIQSKIVSSKASKYSDVKVVVSEIWNSIIISMYRDHLISIEHVQQLIYQKAGVGDFLTGENLKEPIFFLSQDDLSISDSFLDPQSEARRRITFFAQSLSTPMPEAGNLGSIPSFTVLIPHYREKIMLTLKEIIKEEDQYAHITMLEYLKLLHPKEWEYFVRDSKLLAEEFDSESSSPDNIEALHISDLSYISVGYRIAAPEYTLRTRIWSSLRSQTLYRTISGFMNYSRAIKLLYDVETPASETKDDQYLKLEAASITALRKFRIIASLQRFKNFNEEELESTEFLLRAYPELQIAYIEEFYNAEKEEIQFYSSLIDGSCAIMDNGERKPKYRIKLSGNPILGDGKSDNQNHAVIFCRGEYIQLVDANQDNYIEECIKIRSLLLQFDEIDLPVDPYSPSEINPTAIIGTREYIFSENVGVLGDVAAGKEQTFGTLFARTLAQIGGKLHYGHPDFLNSIYMNTRGGVSKAQKGIHLNEDIYAGMNVLLRGGKIKHCEYIQCGKGRDLGFGSILNFTAKIGAGMGEQMLSREYFYLGANLPIDRFMSFFYAHAGFHLNNLFIIFSIKLFILVAISVAALSKEAVICEYSRFKPITDPRKPLNCSNIIPVVQWLNRCIRSIFVVFGISFIPLFIQEITERGLYRAASRLVKHILSLSPFFEIFVCRIYAGSLANNIIVGGAKYIGTERGFATVRLPFATLYSRFALESLYFGAMSILLMFYCTLSMWLPLLLYFWVASVALLISPCIFNPQQFSFMDFFFDYGDYLNWLFRGNSNSRYSSWISFTRISRSKLTGVKKKYSKDEEKVHVINDVKPSKIHLLANEFTFALSNVMVITLTYLFVNSQQDVKDARPSAALLRVLILAVLPIALNIVVLVTFFIISCILGPIGSLITRKFPATLAFIVHLLSITIYIVTFEILWFMQNWDVANTILGVATIVSIQRWILKIGTILFITREFDHDKSNKAWWSGKWITSGLGWYVLTQPIREFVCKIAELSYFPGDFFLGHFILFIQFPILFIPNINTWHSSMLFWLKPNNQHRPEFLLKGQKKRRRAAVAFAIIAFFLIMTCFVAVALVPTFVNIFKLDIEQYLPEVVQELIQPYSMMNSQKGLKKSLYLS